MRDIQTVEDGPAFAGRVAIVTGSSRGIGRAIAEMLVAEGAQVLVTARTADTAKLAAGEIGAAGLGVDLLDPGGPAALVEHAVARFGRVDLMVNNAGIPSIRPALDLDRAEWQRVLDLNTTATFLCAQAAARDMVHRQARGVILNVASTTGLAGFVGRVAYGTSKAAVVMLTKILAAEWAPTIRVNAIAPGSIRTDLSEQQARAGLVDLDRLAARAPLRRQGTPGDVARAARFLLSDRAGYVTGDTLLVDGGWIADGWT